MMILGFPCMGKSYQLNELNVNDEKMQTILIVSDDFKEISLISRHRLIYQVLDKMIKTEIHALSIKALSIDEYNN